MRGAMRFIMAAMIGGQLAVPTEGVLGQTRALSQAECQALRERLAEYAKVSDSVRRMLSGRAARAPVGREASPRAPRPTSDRAEAIRARLEQIAQERQQFEDLRLAALVRFDLARAVQLQEQIGALDQEKASLEKELATLPPGKGTPTPSVQPVGTDVDRIPCEELAAAHEAALKTRRRELGAREDQAGVLPLTPLKGQTREQIARDLAAQFSPWPEAAAQVGLLDQDGDSRLDAIVDVPVRDVFRLYRQRADAAVSIEVFALPGRKGDTEYGEATRRLEEAATRQADRQLTDLLASRPAGPIRIVAETADFGAAYAHFLAGNFADAARIQGGTARSIEFPNFRGDTGRILEILTPLSGGVGMRRVVILPRPNDQELWEETSLLLRPVSYWRTDAELTTTRQTRTSTGAPVGAPSAQGPTRFSLEP